MFRQRSLPQFFHIVQRGKFRLKILLQISSCVRHDFALREVKTERGQRCHDDHHGCKQFGAETGHAFLAWLNRGAHGKSTGNTSPLFKCTGFSSVVLLSIQAFKT